MKENLTVAHKKKIAPNEQMESNNKMLLEIKESVINLGLRLIAKERELFALQEKYNLKVDECKHQSVSLINAQERYNALEAQFKAYQKSNLHPACENIKVIK